MKNLTFQLILLILSSILNAQSNPPAIQWQRSYGGTGGEAPYSIVQTKDGGYIYTGYSDSNNGNVTNTHNSNDCWVVKLDSLGNLQWQKSLGGSNSDNANSIEQTKDGGYIISGNTGSNNGDVSGNQGGYDYWLVKTDIAGNIQWQRCYGGTTTDESSDVELTSDGGYIVVGSTHSNDGDITVNNGGDDVWIVKLAPPPLKINLINNTPEVFVYPNPSGKSFKMNFPNNTNNILILNSLGQVIEKRVVINQTESIFEIFENGIYFVQVSTNKEIITRKVVINNE